MRKLLGITIVVALLSACGNPINRKTAMNYHAWGVEAEHAGNYELAEKNYSRALINAKLGHAPDGGISMAMYNLGRVKGYLCKKNDAEQLLLKALELEESVSGPDSPIMTMRLFELARFYYDHAEHKKAVPYYKRAIPMVKKFNVEESDPIALIDVIKEYSIALKAIGENELSIKAEDEVKLLENKHPNAQPKFVPVRYDHDCV